MMRSTLTFHKESFVLGQKTIHHFSWVMTLLMKVNEKMMKTVSSHWQIPKKYPCDEKPFLIYESKLLELIKYCMRSGNMLTSCRELKNTGSQLTLLLKCNKGIWDFIECFNFFDAFKGTYPACNKYTKYMKICLEINICFNDPWNFQPVWACFGCFINKISNIVSLEYIHGHVEAVIMEF